MEFIINAIVVKENNIKIEIIMIKLKSDILKL